MKNSGDIVKILIDYAVTFLSLVLLSPVILVLALSIRLTGKGPVIYSQRRAGKNGRSFLIYKFRSMYPGNEEILITDPHDKRITPFGRFMRKHKLDEIPNLINVLRGEMSIVGPRPEQQFYIDQIVQKDPRFKKLLSVKPGITSWGQVKYGYASNVEEMIRRMEYDLEYIEKRSLYFDTKIALQTLILILKGQGV
jgi:lipopolysaccharide/colanic/teichoic acid biosynthesis glycosyltransferase